jgi:hypothetical protein
MLNSRIAPFLANSITQTFADPTKERYLDSSCVSPQDILVVRRACGLRTQAVASAAAAVNGLAALDELRSLRSLRR